MGRACCSNVRPGKNVRRCRSTKLISRFSMPARSAITNSKAFFVQSISPVSMTSWLVAPMCTYFVAPGSIAATCLPIAFTSGIAGFPSRSAERRRSLTSKNCTEQQFPMTDAAFWGTSPRSACVAANADSNLSIDSIRASSESSASIWGALNSLSNMLAGFLNERSKVEEDRFVFSLEEDVPLVAVWLSRVGLCQQRIAAARLDGIEHRIVCVSRFVAKVNACNQAIEQPTHEDRNQNVGRLARRRLCLESARLDGPKAELARFVGRYPAEAKRIFERFFLRLIHIPAEAIRLP